MAKVRSPNYPTVNLEEAIKRAEAIYKKEHLHPTAREVLARHIGYGGINGASASTLSALVKYGLLESTGADQFKITRAAQDILIGQPGDPARIEAIRAAALKPTLFSELRNLYGENLPSESNLSSALQRKGFNPNTVGGVIRSYRDTIEFVNAESLGSIAGNSMESDSETTSVVSAPSYSQNGVAIRAGQTGNPSISTQPALDAEWGERLELKVAPATKAFIAFKGQVTREAIEKLVKLLEMQAEDYPSRDTLTPIEIAD